MIKRIFFMISLLLFNFTFYSQTCLPDGITFNYQYQIDNFENDYPGCTEIEGFVIIEGFGITSLAGLSGLTKIGSNLKIDQAANLFSLAGLENLESVGGLDIEFAYNLIDLSGLSGLQSVNPSNVFILGNSALTDVSGLENLKAIAGGLRIGQNNQMTSLNGLNNLESIGYWLNIDHNLMLRYLSGLEKLDSVGLGMTIDDNPMLSDVSGLMNLTYIGGSSRVYNCDAIQDFSGLNSLTTITGSLIIEENDGLIDCDGLNNLVAVDGGLFIKNNSSLAMLAGLEALNQLHLLNLSQNISLTNIESLSHVDPEGLYYLVIAGNSMLSDCSVGSLCEALVKDSIFVLIEDNLAGCNSIEEMQVMCPITATEMTETAAWNVFPNPVQDELYITGEECQPEILNIYDVMGHLVYRGQPNVSRINISFLPSGPYYVEAIAKHKRSMCKVIKL
jgi:hypothetical protein